MNRILSILSVLIAIAAIALGIYNTQSELRIGYVDNTVLFNDYPLKKELQANFENVKNHRKSQLDSLELSLKLLSEELKANNGNDKERVKQFEILRSQYLIKKDQFESDNGELEQRYNDQIWKQLSQYVKDYGEEKGYDVVFGASGTGNIMHADESKNITKEVSEYAKARYTSSSK